MDCTTKPSTGRSSDLDEGETITVLSLIVSTAQVLLVQGTVFEVESDASVLLGSLLRNALEIPSQ